MRVLAVLAIASLVTVGCSSDDDPAVIEATSAPVVEDTTTPTPSESPTDVDDVVSDAATAADDATEGVEIETEEGDGREGIQLTATLTGQAEVPGPGDPGGSGAFSGTLTFLEASGELCYELDAVALTSEVTAAHIHEGAEGESGGVVVELEAPAGGPAEACTTLDAGLTTALDQNPSDFYVNVHTAEFPDGAVRGQLG